MKCCVILLVKNIDLVEENLNLINKQSKKVDHIFICSFDSLVFEPAFTEKFKTKGVSVINTFLSYEKAMALMLKTAQKKGFNFAWFVSNNIISGNETTLSKLFEKIGDNPYSTSIIFSKNNEKIDSFSVDTVKFYSEETETNKIPILNASFDSLLFNLDFVSKDTEMLDNDRYGNHSSFLSRLSTQFGAGVAVLESKVISNVEIKSPPKLRSPKVCAVVVTYNRKEMLKDCIKSLLDQRYYNYDILIVDNNSTDGTYDEIQPLLGGKVKYINTEKNVGGSGGFYFGLKWAYEHGYEMFWIMDDDVITNRESLIQLVEASQKVPNASFYASCVYAPDNTAMNTPEISGFSTNGYKFWFKWLQFGMVRLAHATFVSLLFKREAIEKCGLPCKDYFIWGDDTEYTMRVIGKYQPAYIVGNSSVIHNRAIKASLMLIDEVNENRINMHYYLIRNTLINAMAYRGQSNVDAWFKIYENQRNEILKRNVMFADKKVAVIDRAINDYKNGNYKKDKFNARYELYGQEEIRADILGDENIYNLLNEKCFTSVNKYYETFSFLTGSEDIPVTVLDRDYSEYKFDKNLVYELKNKKVQSLMGGKNYLFINLYSVINNLYAFTLKGGKSFNLCLNKEELESLTSSNVFKDYAWEKTSILNFDKESLSKKIDSFAVEITKRYGLERIIIDEYNSSDLNKEEANLIKEMENRLKNKLLGCKCISSDKYTSSFDVIEDICK